MVWLVCPGAKLSVPAPTRTEPLWIT
jgi:hypothetical protein